MTNHFPAEIGAVPPTITTGTATIPFGRMTSGRNAARLPFKNGAGKARKDALSARGCIERPFKGRFTQG